MQPQPQRIPLRGSCHCGAVRFIVHLTLPHTPSTILPAPRGVQHIYRCNCVTCHKMGLMHVRPVSPTHDFLLLSPLDIFDQADYLTGAKNLHFLSCKTCSVRCVTFAGDGEVVDVNLGEIFGVGSDSKEVTKAWRPREGGGHPTMGHYLSINAHSIDAGQGFDMRELTEQKQVMYCDCYSPEEEESPMTYGRPQLHGSY